MLRDLLNHAGISFTHTNKRRVYSVYACWWRHLFTRTSLYFPIYECAYRAGQTISVSVSEDALAGLYGEWVMGRAALKWPTFVVWLNKTNIRLFFAPHLLVRSPSILYECMWFCLLTTKGALWWTQRRCAVQVLWATERVLFEIWAYGYNFSHCHMHLCHIHISIRPLVGIWVRWV